MGHRLDPLLRPSSIALLGVSPKPGSYGRGILDACLKSGFEGELFLINPNYREIDGHRCYPDLHALPRPVDHCVLGVANNRIEQALQDVIDTGVKAATIFASCQLDEAADMPLLERLRSKARAARLLVCGGNGSGFYNRANKVRCQMSGGAQEPTGCVTFIAQSGSISAAIGNNDGRLPFNLTVSSGQEITTDIADYMDFALGLESTRAIGLFMETVRNPQAFIQALERAAAADIPVVVNKVGRSEASKRFAVSHSGALAGDDAVYDAIFERYGALRVDDPDELVATLQLLMTGRRVTSFGGIAAITDSGGERELLADIAAEQDVAFATISPATRDSLAGHLDYGLEPENPLDAWGTGHGFEESFEACMSDLLADANTSLGLWIADLRDGVSYHAGYARAAMRVIAKTDKPLAIATCYSKCQNTELANLLRQSGIPVLEGLRPALVAARHALAYSRRRQQAAPVAPDLPDPAIIAGWRARCATGQALLETEALALLKDFGVPVVEHRLADSAAAAVEAATKLGFPVALKTATEGIQHKTEVKGVHLNLADGLAVQAAYDDLATRLGPRVLVARMLPPGMEVVFGAINDPQFGPVAMIGAGGIFVETMRDTRFSVPPVDQAAAHILIDRLGIRPLLDGIRGRPALDVDQLARTFSRFSVMIAALGDVLGEVDVNPVIVSPSGAVAVDALIVPLSQDREPQDHPLHAKR